MGENPGVTLFWDDEKLNSNSKSNNFVEDHPLTCAVTKGLKSDSTVLLVPRIPGKENLVQSRKPEYNERKSPLRQTFFVSL